MVDVVYPAWKEKAEKSRVAVVWGCLFWNNLHQILGREEDLLCIDIIC